MTKSPPSKEQSARLNRSGDWKESTSAIINPCAQVNQSEVLRHGDSPEMKTTTKKDWKKEE